jgi:siroheme decarboxylase
MMVEIEFSDKEKELIRICQGDIPLSKSPFEEIASQLRVDSDWIYDTLNRWKDEGVLKKIRGILYHQRAGFKANGMSVWRVPENRIDDIGRQAAEFDEVSHCYHRPGLPDWNYNLYAMIHGKSKAEVEKIAEKISQRVGIPDYQILYSTKEYKKTSMKYFTSEIENGRNE